MNNNNSEILALIPAYNETERVGSVVVDTLAYLPALVVDDGSNDGTSEGAVPGQFHGS